jgi:hypothetical protein
VVVVLGDEPVEQGLEFGDGGPVAVSLCRSCTISSPTSAANAVGEVLGRRERGLNAASPSLR